MNDSRMPNAYIYVPDKRAYISKNACDDSRFYRCLIHNGKCVHCGNLDKFKALHFVKWVEI